MTNVGAEPDWGVLNHYTLAPELWDSGIDIAEQLRELNSNTQIPSCWAAATGAFNDIDMPLTDLEFGINGDTGVLVWADDAGGTWVPVSGSNTDHVEYRMAGYHTTYLPPGSVVPIDVVYAAVAEYQRTRKRPTCVEWQQEPDDTYSS